MLRFSIIVPTLNRRAMLQAAMESVRAQGWEETEIIVVDGGSSDGTREEISGMRGVQLLTGGDRGVYDALNIGMAHAGGDVIGLLNSDDSYEPEIFSAVATSFAHHPQHQAVCGSAVLRAGDRIVEIFSDDSDKALSSPRTALIGACIPNARFFRRAAMQEIGPFSLDYRYVADRDWLLRWYEAGFPTLAIPHLVYGYRQHAGSLTFSKQRRNETAIRLELLQLARHWQRPHASQATRRVARLLEGRCRSHLALTALQAGKVQEAASLLLQNEGAASLAPLGSILRGGFDWAMQRCRAWTAGKAVAGDAKVANF